MTDNRIPSEQSPEPAPEPAPESGRRRGVAVAAAVAAVLAVGGGVGYLASSGGSGGSSAATAGSAPTTSAASSPASPSPGSPSPGSADSSLQPGGPLSTSPAGAGTVQRATGYTASGTQLTVYYYARGCMKYSVSADESTPGKVLVKVVGVSTARPGQMCPMLVTLGHGTTTLKAPVDGRTVVDASSGKALTAPVGRPGLPSGRITHGPVGTNG